MLTLFLLLADVVEQIFVQAGVLLKRSSNRRAFVAFEEDDRKKRSSI